MSVYTKEQAEAKLKKLEKHQAKAFIEKDVEARVSHYHPDATMVHRGVNSYYGHNEIRKAVKPIMESGGATKITLTYADSTTDGKFLIRQGYFTASGKDFPFVQIYKKVGDEYLIFHDEFEYSD